MAEKQENTSQIAPTIAVENESKPKAVSAKITKDCSNEGLFQRLSHWHDAANPTMPNFKNWATKAQQEDKYACDQSVVKVATDTLNPVSRGVLLPIVQYITGMVPVRGVWANIRVPRSDDLSHHELDIVVATLSKLVVFEVKSWEGEVHPTKGEWVMFKEPNKATGWVEVEGRKDEWMVIQPDGTREGRCDPVVQVAAKAELLHSHLVRNNCIPSSFGLAYFVLFTNPNCTLSPAIRGLDEVLAPGEWQKFLQGTQWDKPQWVRKPTVVSSKRSIPAAPSSPGSALNLVHSAVSKVHSALASLTGFEKGQEELSREQWRRMVKAIGSLPTYDVLTFRDGTRVLGDLVRFDHPAAPAPEAQRPRPPPPPPPAFEKSAATDGDLGEAGLLSSFSQREHVSRLRFQHPRGVLQNVRCVVQCLAGSSMATEVQADPRSEGDALYQNEPPVSLLESVARLRALASSGFLATKEERVPEAGVALDSQAASQPGHVQGAKVALDSQSGERVSEGKGSSDAQTAFQSGRVSEMKVPLDTRIVFRPAGSADCMFTAVNSVKSLELSRNPVPRLDQRQDRGACSEVRSPLSLARVTAWLSG